MYFLVCLFGCLISSSVLSCTPPSASRLALITVVTTPTTTANRITREYNALYEDIYVDQQPASEREVSPRKMRQLLKEEQQSLAISYFEWPGCRTIIRVAPYYPQQNNFEFYP